MAAETLCRPSAIKLLSLSQCHARFYIAELPIIFLSLKS